MLSRPPLIVLVRRTSPPPKLSMQSPIEHLHPLPCLTSTTLTLSLDSPRGCGALACGASRAGVARGSGSTRHTSDYRHLSHERCHGHYLNSSHPRHRHQTRLRRYSIIPAYQDNPVKSRCNRRRKQLHGGSHFDMNSS